MTPKSYAEIVWVGVLIVATVVIAVAGFASDTAIGATVLKLAGVVAIRPELLAKVLGFVALPLVHFTFADPGDRMRSAMWTCASVAAAATLLALLLEGGIILQACSVKDANCFFLPSTNTGSTLAVLVMNLLPLVPMALHAVVFSAAVPVFFYGWFLLGLDLWRHHSGDGTPEAFVETVPPPPPPSFAPLRTDGATFGRRR